MSEKRSPIDIVTTTWNRPEMTTRSIKSVKENTKYPYRLIVIDNGSDGVSHLLELREGGYIHDLVLLGENRGLEPAKNIGLSLVRSELFVSTDNDCLAQYGWLGRLVDLMDKYPEYGAIACRTQVMIGTGNIYDGNEHEDVVDFPHPGGSLRIMRTDPVKKAGGWRNDVESRGQEERRICGELRKLGYKTGFAVGVKCYHMFGKDANWGYGDMKPEDHGHNPIWHPAIQGGDNEEAINEWLQQD